MLPEWAANLVPWACATIAGAGVLALTWLWRRNADWTARADYAARTKGDAGLSLFRDDPEPTIHMTGCARCGGEPGDIGTVHYKGLCAVTHAIREVHWCCPDDCELTPPYPAVPTAEAVDEWTRRVQDEPTVVFQSAPPPPLVSAAEPVIPQPEPEELQIDPPTGRLYADGRVTLGRHVLHRECLDARKNGQYGDICAECRPSLVGSASELPR